MQNASKPGVLTPIILAVWVCTTVEARARFQCPGGTTPPNISQNTPPPRPGLTNEKTDITYIADVADIVDFLGYSSQVRLKMSMAKNV